MGWYKSLDTAKSEPAQPATLADIQQDGLLAPAGATDADTTRLLIQPIITTLGPSTIPEIAHHMRCVPVNTDIALPPLASTWRANDRRIGNFNIIMTYTCKKVASGSRGRNTRNAIRNRLDECQ